MKYGAFVCALEHQVDGCMMHVMHFCYILHYGNKLLGMANTINEILIFVYSSAKLSTS